METEIRFYYRDEDKDLIIKYLKRFTELKYLGRFYEITDQYNHPMKEYDFYSKEIDGRFRVRKTIGDNISKCMITWKRRLKSGGELVHNEEEIELSILPNEYDNLIKILTNVLHLEIVESYERYRNVFENEDVEIVVDEYPFGICIEIENKSKDKNAESVIKEWTNKLKLDIKDAYKLSWDDRYAELCNNQNIKVNNIVRFNEIMPKETNIIRGDIYD